MKYESQKIAFAYFLVAMILFLVQVSGGLLAGWIYVSPNTFSDILPFNVVRMLHTNALIVWLLLGFFGAAGSWHQGPNQLVTWIDLTATNSFHQYLFEAPVDEAHTKVFLVSLRNWLLEDQHEARMAEATRRVVGEDMAIVENLNPTRTPDSNTKEVLVPGDTAIAHYREWLRKWDAKGWRIDHRALNARLGDYAVAIPCPARRTSDNWVLETVPLLAPRHG